MRILKVFLALFIGILILPACQMLQPIKITPSTSYTIATWPAKNVNPKKGISNKTLLITMPTAAPGYQSSKMIYVMVPYQLKAFSDHRWVAPPADLLMPIMANKLRTAGYFKAVVTSPFSGTATYQLNTQLLTLQQEFLKPESCVRVRIEFTLVSVATGEVIANRVFEATVWAPENNPYSGVLAANVAINQVLDQMTTFVVKHAQ